MRFKWTLCRLVLFMSLFTSTAKTTKIILFSSFFFLFHRVKFGIPLESVCESAHNDIPGPLLVMILKLNKEAPYKKDVFRAPGHQASMKKLIHFLQVIIIHYFAYFLKYFYIANFPPFSFFP